MAFGKQFADLCLKANSLPEALRGAMLVVEDARIDVNAWSCPQKNIKSATRAWPFDQAFKIGETRQVLQITA
jgi:hypothetical protein